MAFDIRNLPFAGTVTRWHSVNCYRYPSVAEHSGFVALYAREIASRVYPSLSAEDQVLLYELALMHDLSELVTGDMPSPIKCQLKTVFPPSESPLDRLETSICPDAVLDRAQSECPDGEWSRAHEVREVAMSLTHVQIDEI